MITISEPNAALGAFECGDIADEHAGVLFRDPHGNLWLAIESSESGTPYVASLQGGQSKMMVRRQISLASSHWPMRRADDATVTLKNWSR